MRRAVREGDSAARRGGSKGCRMDFAGLNAPSARRPGGAIVSADAGSILGAPIKISARDVNVFYGDKQALFDVTSTSRTGPSPP